MQCMGRQFQEQNFPNDIFIHIIRPLNAYVDLDMLYVRVMYTYIHICGFGLIIVYYPTLSPRNMHLFV